MKLAFLRCILGLFAVGAAVSADEEPWYVTKFGEKLTTAGGGMATTRKFLDGKMIGVYFAASWNANCLAFMPTLAKFHSEAKRKYDFEIVFVSRDRSEEDMIAHMNRKCAMPWFAVPFDSPRRAELMKEFNGVPRLIIFDKDGKLLSNNARWDVSLLGAKAVLRWRSANYKPLTYLDAGKRYDRKHPKKGSKKHSR